MSNNGVSGVAGAMGSTNGGAMSMGTSEQSKPNYKWDNERLLLKAIKHQLNITDEDMHDPFIVKSKLRDLKIDEVLD